jgi:hypothetical protein
MDAVREGRKIRFDALPENTVYADNGCDLYPSCLQCPLPRCRYEDPGGARAMLRPSRDASIRRLSHVQGFSVEQVSVALGVSRRTVFRVLNAAARGRKED